MATTIVQFWDSRSNKYNRLTLDFPQFVTFANRLIGDVVIYIYVNDSYILKEIEMGFGYSEC